MRHLHCPGHSRRITLTAAILQFALARRVHAILDGNAVRATALGLGTIVLAIAAGYVAAAAGSQHLLLGISVVSIVRLSHCAYTTFLAAPNG